MSVTGRLTWVKIDGRPHIEALALEVLLRDFVELLRSEDELGAADAVERVAEAVARVITGTHSASL